MIRPVIAALAVVLCGLLTSAARLEAVNIAEAFLMLPIEQCGGYNTIERQAMLDHIIAEPGAFGESSVPDVEYPWVRVISANYMILQRPGFGNISYKLFDGRGNFQILAICRGRQRTSPADPSCRFDLCLYRLDRNGLTELDHNEVMPNISILDFITLDTLSDPDAARDIAARGPTYGQCLTCNASAQDSRMLDIKTTTSVNAAACDNFLPPFGLLPLTWNGLEFTKPYDRAAPKDLPF
ncbi:hypothetical protein C4J81_08310 [Deltaproteobacteria bacterium Smac51]|nr:hypothetical protein C4J81_08310 [Deltaproteobacteria bacterium Smac51]